MTSPLAAGRPDMIPGFGMQRPITTDLAALRQRVYTFGARAGLTERGCMTW